MPLSLQHPQCDTLNQKVYPESGRASRRAPSSGEALEGDRRAKRARNKQLHGSRMWGILHAALPGPSADPRKMKITLKKKQMS